jgi:riboflavin kinase/FMN adenylyltransferase
LKTIRQPSELGAAGRPVAVAIGVFDGVHLGHREVIGRMLAAARQRGGLGVVVTFDRHPNAVVAPERTPPALQSLAQRLRAFAELGAAATWCIHFDADFSRRTGEQFVRDLVHGFGRVTTVCVGSQFQFGHRRQGNVALLERLGAELGFVTEAVEPVRLDGQVVSSTLVRELIGRGALEAAGRLLGRPYALAGEVVRGAQVGRQLGFPTANLEVTGRVLPPHGVYAAQVRQPEGTLGAVMNLGFRPTVDARPAVPHLEVHLLDTQRDLYGQELEVTPVKRLRDEVRFDSLEALRAQIARDVITARLALQRPPAPDAPAN